MALIGAIRALLRVADLRTMTIVGLFVAPDLFVFSGVNMDLTIIFFGKNVNHHGSHKFVGVTCVFLGLHGLPSSWQRAFMPCLHWRNCR